MKFFYCNEKRTLKPNPEQTFMGVWFHDDNITDEQKSQMELCLHQTFYYYRIFNNIEQFCSYMYKKQHVAEIVFIISISNLSLYGSWIDLVREYSTTAKIYTFLPMKTVRPLDVDSDDIDNLFEKISDDIKHFFEKTKITVESMNISRTNEISTSSNKFMSRSDRITPIRHLADESMGFLSFLTMVKILLEISYNNNDIKDMWEVCRKLPMNKDIESKTIEDLSKNYASDKAINYYTKSSCLFYIVNQACRTENVQYIYNFRVYISDLNRQLSDLSTEQERQDIKSSIKKVCRGKVLSASVLQQLIDNEHGLISMNGFLSTTMSPQIADIYSAVGENIDDGYISVQFVLTIDTIRQPYAHISSCSAVTDEVEILFSLGTIWRIESIKPENNLYKIELISWNDLDSRLDALFKNHTRNGCDLSSVGDVLRELGNYDEAEWFYQKMLGQDPLSDETLIYLYYNMAMMRKELGCNSEARQYFQEEKRLVKSSITKPDEIRSPREIYIYDIEPTLVAAYNNIGLVHEKKHDFDEAINCYTHALKVKNGSTLQMAIVNNNLGLLYSRYGDYQQARNCHAASVELADETNSCWPELKRNLIYVENIVNA